MCARAKASKARGGGGVVKAILLCRKWGKKLRLAQNEEKEKENQRRGSWGAEEATKL